MACPLTLQVPPQRLDPIGKDAAGNTYYHTADDRLWMQRPVPEASSSPADSTVPIRRPKTLLGLQAGPRDKSKKGTVTGVVRFKLRKDPKTGAFEQVATGGGDDAASDAGGSVKGEGDEGDEAVRGKPEQEEERELEEWEREYWRERIRAETTPGFVEWEAVSPRGVVFWQDLMLTLSLPPRRSASTWTIGDLSPTALPTARTATRSS